MLIENKNTKQRSEKWKNSILSMQDVVDNKNLNCLVNLILFLNKKNNHFITGQEISLYGDINPWYSNNIYYVGTLSTNNSEIPNHFGLNN